MARAMLFKASVPSTAISVDEWRNRRARWVLQVFEPELMPDLSDLVFEPCRLEKCPREGVHPAHEWDGGRGRPITGEVRPLKPKRDRSKAAQLARLSKGLYETVSLEEAGSVVRCTIAGCADCDGSEMWLFVWKSKHSAVRR